MPFQLFVQPRGGENIARGIESFGQSIAAGLKERSNKKALNKGFETFLKGLDDEARKEIGISLEDFQDAGFAEQSRISQGFLSAIGMKQAMAQIANAGLQGENLKARTEATRGAEERAAELAPEAKKNLQARTEAMEADADLKRQELNNLLNVGDATKPQTIKLAGQDVVYSPKTGAFQILKNNMDGDMSLQLKIKQLEISGDRQKAEQVKGLMALRGDALNVLADVAAPEQAKVEAAKTLNWLGERLNATTGDNTFTTDFAPEKKKEKKDDEEEKEKGGFFNKFFN